VGVEGRALSGDERTRTADPLLAKQVLYQLSYVPLFTWGNAKPRPCTPLLQLKTLQHLIADGAGMRDESTSVSTGQSVGDVRTMVASFRRHLRAGNLSERTIETYLEACTQLADFLERQGMPVHVSSIQREHIEAFIEHLLETRKPATASIRYRSLQQLFKFLEDEGEIAESPMRRMRPPRVPEAPPPVPAARDLRKLLEACEGSGFDERRDRALLMVFIDTGARLSEIANLKLEETRGRTSTSTTSSSRSRERVGVHGSCHWGTRPSRLSIVIYAPDGRTRTLIFPGCGSGEAVT
jgi:Phage integrase, N-terminal SAM-like domain